MKANYHTHTARCGHASGTDEQYVRAALAQGFDVLGFSDHVPWPYASDFTNPGVRMHVRCMGEYIASVRALREKYAGQIEILLGFECEYFPAYIDWLAETVRRERLDYLILGNHYDGTDETGMYFGGARTAAQLLRYVEMTVRGVQTGLFAYLAHPDLFMRRYPRFDENCRAAARDLARACAAANMPMEYNLHDRYCGAGFMRRPSYPCREFFEIALEEGVRVIVGLDAHEPEEIENPTQWDRASRELAAFGARRVDHLALTRRERRGKTVDICGKMP